jgi:hypothetical protein
LDISHWSTDHGVPFVETDAMAWLCMAARDDSRRERALSVRFFLRVVRRPCADTMLNRLEQEDVLANCISMLGSDDAALAAEVLNSLVAIWEGGLHGRYTHSFFRQPMGFMELDEFRKAVLELRDAVYGQSSAAADDAIAFLARNGIDIENGDAILPFGSQEVSGSSRERTPELGFPRREGDESS